MGARDGCHGGRLHEFRRMRLGSGDDDALNLIRLVDAVVELRRRAGQFARLIGQFRGVCG